jgi:hypothetical protein
MGFARAQPTYELRASACEEKLLTSQAIAHLLLADAMTNRTKQSRQE